MCEEYVKGGMTRRYTAPCVTMDNEFFDIIEITQHFNFDGRYIGFSPSNNGHINNTFVISFENPRGEVTQYILQEINTTVFRNPDELMENIESVTSYLADIIRKNGGDPLRETLYVYRTREDTPYYLDKNGHYWRVYNYVTRAHSYQSIEKPEDFYRAARAFGEFQCKLADYPSSTLHDTIPNFHNTVSRLNDFKIAVKNDVAGRAAGVRDEIAFYLERERDAEVLLSLLEKGELPLRVTHNDTKLNNVLFDDDTEEGICVIDLDTVMPGLSLYDFGDSIRFGANTASEDEEDLSKVCFSLELYEQYTKGYLEAAGSALTPCEIEYLPFSAKLMTYECGVRFLTDYLNGDVYFRIGYPEHNLIRSRTQLKLVSEMEKYLPLMKEITQKYI